MNRNQRTKDVTGKKESMESKIPKSTKSSAAKEASSKISNEKEREKSLKRTLKVDTISSSKGKQMQINSLQKNVRPMSIAKISKDVMNHLETEGLNLDELTSEYTTLVTMKDKENTTKRAPLKEKYSQTSQKPSGSLSKKPSKSDLKPCTAFGGMRLTSKKIASRQKGDFFHEMTKGKKRENQEVTPPEPTVAKETTILTEELKTADSAKTVMSKGLDRFIEENLENLPNDEAKSSKAASLIVKEAALKKCTTFGSISFSPKWQSTPLKPDLFDNVQKDSKPDKKIHSIDTPDSTKAIVREKVQRAKSTPDETFQSPSTKAELFKTPNMNEISFNVCTAYAGMRLIPKRKSVLPKPDVFENERKGSEIDDKEMQTSDASAEDKKTSSYATKTIMATETQRQTTEKSERCSTELARSTEVVSTITKEASRVAAFGGIRLADRVRSTSIKSDIFDDLQKESKPDNLEFQPADSYTKELKKNTSKALIKAETQHLDIEKVLASTIRKPDSSEIHIEKKMKEVIPKSLPAFGGLPFKPRQKNLRDVFEIQKQKLANQEPA